MPITDGLDQALTNVALTLLDADNGPPPLVVFDGVVPAGTPVNAGYVLVYSYLSRPSDDPDNPATGRSGVWVCRWILHNVGATASAARAIAERSRTALLDIRPTVSGLSCGLIRLEDAQPPQRDETTGGPVMDAVQTYSLRATS
jgi:hypothetical protein